MPNPNDEAQKNIRESAGEIDWHQEDAIKKIEEIEQKIQKIRTSKPSLEYLKNRYSCHAPKGNQAVRYEKIRATILSAAILCVEETPASPEQTRALNALDDAMFLFNASIARTE